MTGPERYLSASAIINTTVRQPSYVPVDHGVGIVHLGVGAFHRAHQAVYTDDALGATGGDWRIVGASLRNATVANTLNPQNGRYTLIESDVNGSRGRLIASIERVIDASNDRKKLILTMIKPCIRIVSLTVTEKAYGIKRTSGSIDDQHPDIVADLANPHNPVGVLGILVESLRLRRDAGLAPYTVLCCDNLPENGALLKAGMIDFSSRVDPVLSDWIAVNVAFPSTMVDRITPAATSRTYDNAKELTGYDDRAAIETEGFSQWVVEDHFPSGRPQWEAGGALFVTDVAPYENMKLRMLNGAHSMIAYVGFLAGCKYVRDVMEHPILTKLVERHFKAAAATLTALPEIDFDEYSEALIGRFRNPAIAHETYQIAMDGTEKLPQRILRPAQHALACGQDIRPFAFAIAAWMRYCLGEKDDGNNYALRDPREDEIRAKLHAVAGNAEAISQALHSLPDLFPDDLQQNTKWRSTTASILESFMINGIEQTSVAE